MYCGMNSVNLQLLILLEGIRILDGACSWPTDFAGSTWTDSSKGELVFEDSSMSGWLLNVENLSLDRWECYSTDYFESQGYLIIKTTETFVLYQTRHYYGFLCMQLTKITDVSYRYYEIEPIQENVRNERLNVHDVAMDEPSNLTAMCLLDHGAVGSEYKVLIKKEFEEEAKIRCPYSFLGNFNYEHTSSAGTVACLEADSISLCIDNKEIKFDYDACPTKIAYSASDTVWCVDSVPVGDNNFVTVYNGIDPTVDDANTFRFSCFGVSGDGRNASVTPQNCKKDQSPYSVPTDNSGTQTGATLTMPAEPNFCPPCPILKDPPKGSVSIATNGAVTTATYECVNDYTIAGHRTRICQDNNTWSGHTPSCTCDTPLSPTNGAVTVSTDGTTATYTCIANYTLDGRATRTCETDTNTWTGTDPVCLPDGGSDTNVTQTGTSLLPAVITMAVLLLILIPALTFATYKYCKLKKRGHLKGDTFRDDDVPKSIPIAAVPPSAAPVDHQKPLFESGRATSLSFAPDAHSQYTSRGILSANSRSSTASISRLNLEMIRESTSSSVYGNGGPAPWSKKKPIVSENPDSTREDSLTLSSLYSSFSSPRRGYPHTPRYSDDMDDSTGVSPLTEESTVHETSSPRKSPKKRKKASNKLSHADTEEGANIPSYMKGTKSSVRKVYEEGIMGENKQSAKTTLSVFGNERELTNSGRTTPKLTSPRV